MREWNAHAMTSASLGMTFVEVILVMLIVGILAAIVIPKLDMATFSRASVDGGAYMIASDIRYAQEFAMTNRISQGILFTSGSSVYTFNPSSSIDPSGQLPSGVTVDSDFTVTFNSLGEPIEGGGESFSISGGAKTIGIIDYTGKVE